MDSRKQPGFMSPMSAISDLLNESFHYEIWDLGVQNVRNAPQIQSWYKMLNHKRTLKLALCVIDALGEESGRCATPTTSPVAEHRDFDASFTPPTLSVSAITRRLTPVTPCESLKIYGIRLMTPAPAMESDSVSPAAAWNQPGATGIMKLPEPGFMSPMSAISRPFECVFSL